MVSWCPFQNKYAHLQKSKFGTLCDAYHGKIADNSGTVTVFRSKISYLFPESHRIE